MKAKEIKGLSISDLNTKVIEEKTAISRLKLNHSISPLENPLVIRTTRKNIARLLTELNSKKSI